jgi:hypothetical protein
MSTSGWLKYYFAKPKSECAAYSYASGSAGGVSAAVARLAAEGQ